MASYRNPHISLIWASAYVFYQDEHRLTITVVQDNVDGRWSWRAEYPVAGSNSFGGHEPDDDYATDVEACAAAEAWWQQFVAERTVR